MRIEKLKQQNRLILILGTALILFFLFLGFRQYQALGMLKRNIIEEENKIAILEERLTRLLLIKEQAPYLKAQLENLEQVLLQDLSEQNTLKLFQRAMIGIKGRVLETRFGDPERGQDFSKLPLRIVFEGDYYSLLDFLQNLKQELYLFNLADLSVQKTGSEEDLIRADLKIELYYAN